MLKKILSGRVVGCTWTISGPWPIRCAALLGGHFVNNLQETGTTVHSFFFRLTLIQCFSCWQVYDASPSSSVTSTAAVAARCLCCRRLVPMLRSYVCACFIFF